jgi:hypothetical protein
LARFGALVICLLDRLLYEDGLLYHDRLNHLNLHCWLNKDGLDYLNRHGHASVGVHLSLRLHRLSAIRSDFVGAHVGGDRLARDLVTEECRVDHRHDSHWLLSSGVINTAMAPTKFSFQLQVVSVLDK